MAVKHVKEYYNKIADQYVEMLDNLKEMQEAYELGQVSQEQFENLKKIVEPLKSNYERISWIMYLLAIPQRDKKVKKWKKQDYMRVSEIPEENSLDATFDENSKALSEMKIV